MTTNSPTCILSGPCLLGPQGPPRVATISSEVESSTFYCDRCLYLQDQNTPMTGDRSQCCPVTGVLPAITSSQDSTDEEVNQQDIQQQPHSSALAHHSSNPTTPTCKASKPGKSCGWKTSKFFSKTMSSGEILRGLKKLSLTGSSSDGMEGVESPKPRKSKSAQLKKRSSYGNDEVAVEVDSSHVGGFRNPVSAAVPILSKALSLIETGSTTKMSNPGIVCKKEDLKAILCSATSNTLTKKLSTASPTRRTRAPLRQTKSASFEPIPKKDPIRRTGSEDARYRRSQFVENNEEAKKTKDHSTDNTLHPPEPVKEVLVVENLNVRNQNLSAEGATLARHQTSSEGCLSEVKWDECEVVDAVLIGDAIETFLKVSMSAPEKRVSFRRNSADKKAKSDG